jgi:lysozyme
MGKLSELDGCAVPAQLEPILAAIKHDTGCVYASVYRGSDAAAILNAHGKHTQQQLWDATPAQRAAWGVLGTPNPPGRSTHELRSDGVAYAGPAGRALAWWQCGIDVDDAHVAAFIAAAGKRGWAAFRPYSSGVEYHHVDFRRLPVLFNPDYRVGSKGPMVMLLAQRLRTLGFTVHPTFTFDKQLEQAVKLFQRDHHLTSDGIAGPITWATLKALAAAKKRQEKKDRKAAPPKAKKKPRPKPKRKPKRPKKPATTATRISASAVAAIAGFEGGESADGLFHPYFDKMGDVWTIGYGHTGGVSARSRPLTKTQALALLESDLNKSYVPAVLSAAREYKWLPLNQGKLDALSSFCFNLGPGDFAPSHSLGAALKAHNVAEAASAFLLYDKDANDVTEPGLVRRREWERDRFLGRA